MGVTDVDRVLLRGGDTAGVRAAGSPGRHRTRPREAPDGDTVGDTHA